MQIIEWPQFLENGFNHEKKFTSMTIGVFDGVHRGHRALIDRIVSHNAGLMPVIITFRENHKTGKKGQITGDREQSDILTFQQRLAVFEELGIQKTIVIDFTDEFKRMPGNDFFQVLLKHGRVRFFAVGSDFRCGYNLDMDANAIKKHLASYDIPAEIVQQVTEGSLPISSSRIRCAIAAGDHSLAQAMLGYVLK